MEPREGVVFFCDCDDHGWQNNHECVDVSRIVQKMGDFEQCHVFLFVPTSRPNGLKLFVCPPGEDYFFRKAEKFKLLFPGDLVG